MGKGWFRQEFEVLLFNFRKSKYSHFFLKEDEGSFLDNNNSKVTNNNIGTLHVCLLLLKVSPTVHNYQYCLVGPRYAPFIVFDYSEKTINEPFMKLSSTLLTN